MVAWGSAKRGLTLDRGGAWHRAQTSSTSIPISQHYMIPTALLVYQGALARRARPSASAWSVLSAAPLRTANRAGAATLWIAPLFRETWSYYPVSKDSNAL